jgi:hypothetical protein
MEEDELDTRMERAPVGACLSSLPISLSLSSLNWFTSEDSVETFDGMKAAIPRLRKKLGADPDYFRRVYLYTFDFARSEGQRSLPVDIALAFWGLLLPLGLKGGALRHSPFGDCDDYFMKVDGGGGAGGWNIAAPRFNRVGIGPCCQTSPCNENATSH